MQQSLIRGSENQFHFFKNTLSLQTLRHRNKEAMESSEEDFDSLPVVEVGVFNGLLLILN